jgi:hypothetical protein
MHLSKRPARVREDPNDGSAAQVPPPETGPHEVEYAHALPESSVILEIDPPRPARVAVERSRFEGSAGGGDAGRERLLPSWHAELDSDGPSPSQISSPTTA